jgi:hypothetical protein
MKETVKRAVEDFLYPQLRPYGRADRDRLLERASETPFDLLEWLGILVSLVVVGGVTRYSTVDLGLVDRLAMAIANFVVAVPLLLLTIGPFLIRRKRRGLRSHLKAQEPTS